MVVATTLCVGGVLVKGSWVSFADAVVIGGSAYNMRATKQPMMMALWDFLI